MNRRYILDGAGNPQPEPDLVRWAKWFESGARVVAKTRLGKVRVSTVFLGLDHQWADGLPLLWETMIFGGPHDGYQDRYTSRTEALAGHDKAVALAREPR